MFDLDQLVNAAAIVVPLAGGTLGWVHAKHKEITDKVNILDKQAAVYDQSVADLKELINTRFDTFDYRVERVERSLNGYLK